MLHATLALVQETRASLLKRDWKLLQEALNRQQHAITAASELGKQRVQIRREIGEQLGLAFDNATIGALAARTTETLGTQLLNARDRLTQSTGKINVLNRANAVLAMQTNQIVTGMIHHFMGIKPSPRNYERSGRLESTEQSSILDADI